MADRYWVGGTATWDGTAGTKWATTSGGAGGAAVPTSSDDVFFDANSGTGTTTIGSGAVCLDLDTTGFTGTLNRSSALTVHGNVLIAAATTLGSNRLSLTMAGSGTQTVTTNGKQLQTLTISSSGTVQLLDDLSCHFGGVVLTAGTFDANGFAVTTGTVNISGTGARSLLMGGGTWRLAHLSPNQANAWNAGTTTNLTFDAEGSKIEWEPSNDARAFVGGGLTYDDLEIIAGSLTDDMTISGDNTFAAFTIQPHSFADRPVTFTAGSTQTITGAVSLTGVSGTRRINLVSSSPGTPFTLSKASGTVNGDWLDITDSTATGGATWDAGGNSIDGGGNTGWIFIPAQEIEGVLFSDADTFGSNVIDLDQTKTIVGALFSDGDQFGTSTVGRGAVGISAALYADADSFGASTLSIDLIILGSIFLEGETFGTSVVYTPLVEFIAPGRFRCDRCARIRGESAMRKEWTGLFVCREACWEPRHPQELLRGVADRQNVPWTRPEQEPIFLSPGDVTGADL